MINHSQRISTEGQYSLIRSELNCHRQKLPLLAYQSTWTIGTAHSTLSCVQPDQSTKSRYENPQIMNSQPSNDPVMHVTSDINALEEQEAENNQVQSSLCPDRTPEEIHDTSQIKVELLKTLPSSLLYDPVFQHDTATSESMETSNANVALQSSMPPILLRFTKLSVSYIPLLRTSPGNVSGMVRMPCESTESKFENFKRGFIKEYQTTTQQSYLAPKHLIQCVIPLPKPCLLVHEANSLTAFGPNLFAGRSTQIFRHNIEDLSPIPWNHPIDEKLQMLSSFHLLPDSQQPPVHKKGSFNSSNESRSREIQDCTFEPLSTNSFLSLVERSPKGIIASLRAREMGRAGPSVSQYIPCVEFIQKQDIDLDRSNKMTQYRSRRSGSDEETKAISKVGKIKSRKRISEESRSDHIACHYVTNSKDVYGSATGIARRLNGQAITYSLCKEWRHIETLLNFAGQTTEIKFFHPGSFQHIRLPESKEGSVYRPLVQYAASFTTYSGDYNKAGTLMFGAYFMSSDQSSKTTASNIKDGTGKRTRHRVAWVLGGHQSGDNQEWKAVHDISVQSNGVMYSAGRDGQVICWGISSLDWKSKTAPTGIPRKRVLTSTSKSPFLRIANHPELGKNFVAGACADGSVIAWEPDKLQFQHKEPRKQVQFQFPKNKKTSKPAATCVEFGIWSSYMTLFAGFERGYGAGGSAPASIHAWSLLKPSAPLYQFTVPKAVAWIDISRSGRFLTAGTTGNMDQYPPDFGDEIVRVFDATGATGNRPLIQVVTGQPDCNAVGMSLCESYIYSCGTDNCVKVYDRRFITRNRDGFTRVLANLLHPKSSRSGDQDHTGVHRPSWTSSGLLYSGGEDGQVHIWDVRRGEGEQECYTLRNHETQLSSITALSLSQDELWLAVGTEAGETCLWSLMDVGSGRWDGDLSPSIHTVPGQL
ncbi:WD40-repeat-containing domain protein [Cladochytrium replicatum]|nr:WD40-repeat-containing domain protein [Cladochytrium replicatum]